jgi:SAM-dependent methyltransferase
MPRNKVIMNLGCSRGQDMYKDKYCKPSAVIYVDVSERCLFETERRWKKNKYPFPATFVQADFCSPDFLKNRDLVIYQENGDRKRGEQRTPTVGTIVSTGNASDMVDAISCQFACHYAFYSEDSARQFIDNIYQTLKPGGMFIGTAPQGEQIIKVLNKVKDGSKYDSGKYAIWLDEETCSQYKEKEIKSSYVPYWFYMKNTIQSKQWTMYVKDLITMCEDKGMKMIYMNNLKCEYEKEIVNMRNQGVIERMGIKDTTLDDTDMKNIGMYFMFVFVKPLR